MESIIEVVGDYLSIILYAVIGILVAAAAIRSIIKVKKGKKVDIPPVGVYNDLPSSVTGLNKYKERK